MGLDMYLNRRIFLWGDERKNLKITGLRREIRTDKVSYIIEEIGYWRKANAIHKWFVDNVQGGNDDCERYNVSARDMRGLLETVNRVLESSELVDGDVHTGTRYHASGEVEELIEKGKIIKDPTVAKVLLPSSSGFFFGSDDYDEYYYEQLIKTKEILEQALENDEDYYEYHSDW